MNPSLRPCGPVLGAAFVAAIMVPAPAAPAQSANVHNTSPQRTVNPPHKEDPLYYPLRHYEAGAGEPEADTPEHLLWQLRDLHSAMRHREALTVVEQLVAAVPDRPLSHYNHACVLARLRRLDEAMAALDRAIDAGWRNLEHTLLDPDLGPAREHERFGELVARMRSIRHAERLRPAPLRDDPWPQVVEDVLEITPLYLDRYQVPGAAVALIRDGRVVWAGGFGVERLAGGGPMTGESRFRLRGPVDLLALMASLRQQEVGRYTVASLIRHGIEIAASPRMLPAGRGHGDPALLVGNLPPDDPGVLTPLSGNDASLSGTLGLLVLSVEMSSNQSFARFCREQILDPAGAAATEFTGRRHDPATVIGHTPFGTPVPEGASSASSDQAVVSTATDLARLLATLGTAEDATAALGSAGDRAVLMSGTGTGLRIGARRTAFGDRLEIADDHRGVGCLMIWYPAGEDGIVVLYNGQGGEEAAVRVAQSALGGE